MSQKSNLGEPSKLVKELLFSLDILDHHHKEMMVVLNQLSSKLHNIQDNGMITPLEVYELKTRLMVLAVEGKNIASMASEMSVEIKEFEFENYKKSRG